MDTETTIPALAPFLDPEGRLVSLPSRYKKQLLAYYYLASGIEAGRVYTEGEINDFFDRWTVFHDPAALRRALCDRGLLYRTNDGSRYWRPDALPSLEQFLARCL